MMDTHAPRKVGRLSDEMSEPTARPTNLSPFPENAARRPLRAQRVFTESDDFVEAAQGSDEFTQKKAKRRGKIKQLPLHLVGAEDDQPGRSGAGHIKAQGQSAVAQVLSGMAAMENVVSYPLGDIAHHIRKVSADLLVGAAVATASFAELAANLLSLLGLAVLIFPGQFVHTCLTALYYRATGQARNYALAFTQSWETYRNIPNAYRQVGPYEVHLSFVVGLSLASPFLLLKCLELANVMLHWLKP